MLRSNFLRLNLHEGKLRTTFLAVFSVLVLFIGSVIVWSYVNRTVESQRSADFESLVDIQTMSFKEISMSAVNYLYDLRGNFTLGGVSADRWREYVFASGIEKRYPGIFSFSYVEIVGRKDLVSFENQLKENGGSYINYSVFPSTNNSDLYPVKYLYTFDRDVSALLGYDVGSSEVQVAAIRESVLTGSPSMTTLFNLSSVVQNSTESNYVITLPVYSNSGSLELTPSERQRFLIGFVNAWIKPENLFSNVTGISEELTKNLTYIVREGDAEVFSYQKGLGIGNIKSVREVNILGRDFLIEFSNINPYELSSLIENLPFNSLVVLILVNLLWDGTLLAMIIARTRAQKLADDAIKDLVKFRQAVDGVSDLVIITDPDGHILYANDATKKITGYSKKEIMGNNPSLWGGQMDKEYFEDFWHILKVEKKVFTGQLKNKRKSGEVYEVELSVWPILDERRELIYLVGIEKDITKTIAVEKMKTEFISLASHQLRTPLSAVKWFGKMLADGEAGPLSNTQADYLNIINKSNEREIQLVNSLLNVSRIESGRIKISPKPTNMKTLIESVVGDIKVDLDKNKRTIVLEMPKNLPEIVVDPDLMRHVYINLLMNSVKYSDQNDSIKLNVSIKDGDLLTMITDSGIGIPATEKQRIFEKFFRGTNALKKETDGSGLGLYLTRSIVESSGGKIWFESKENTGTTFWFTLPLSGIRKEKDRTSLV